MGWVVYDNTGRMLKYYKKSGPARAAVTRYRKTFAAHGYGWPQAAGCCEYRDFEGILMGLEGAELKLWQFCNRSKG